MDYDGYDYMDYLSSDEDENDFCTSHYYSSNESSSEEENGQDLDVLLQNAAKRHKTKIEAMTDPFEDEMCHELDRAMNQLKGLKSLSARDTVAPAASSSTAGLSIGTAADPSREQYDSIYFDSDEDEADQDVRKQRSTVSDSELLYDPTLDDQDQEWMDRHRGPMAARATKGNKKKCNSGEQQRKKDEEATSKKSAKKANSNASGATNSDAVLNCPGCMTMLCADCQRHSTYGSQYRAIFVFGCRVDYTQLLSFPKKLSKKEIWKNRKKERKMNKRKYRERNEQEDMEGFEDDKKSLTMFNGNLNEENDAEGKFDHSNSIATKESRINSDVNNSSCAEETLNTIGKDTKTNRMNEESSSSKPNENINNCEDTDSNKITNTDCHKDTLLTNSVVPSVRLEKSILCKTEKRNFDCMKSTDSPVKKVHFLGDAKEGKGSESLKDIKCNLNGVDENVLCAPNANNGEQSINTGDEAYHPVMCQYCNTKVAVMDKDEVYHFFNVITSY